MSGDPLEDAITVVARRILNRALNHHLDTFPIITGIHPYLGERVKWRAKMLAAMTDPWEYAEAVELLARWEVPGAHEEADEAGA